MPHAQHQDEDGQPGDEGDLSDLLSELRILLPGAQMLTAFLIILPFNGGSYGAGNYAMCGRGLDPRFIFAWPNSRTAVMGGAQAGKVLRIVTEAKQLKDGLVPDPKVLDMLEQVTAQKLDSQSTALYGSANLWDDGLIDPRDTRTLLGFVLDICHEAEVRQLQPNSFGVARF